MPLGRSQRHLLDTQKRAEFHDVLLDVTAPGAPVPTSSLPLSAAAPALAVWVRDRQLAAYGLINHASVRTDLGDGAGVLDLCDAALANSDTN